MFVRNDGGMQRAGFNEMNDCAVRAYATYKQIPYEQAHALFKKAGRKDRRATPVAMIKKLLGSTGQIKGLTLNGLMQSYPQGRVYAVKRGHAFALVDGVLHDTWKVGGKSRIMYMWTDALPAESKPAASVEDKRAKCLAVYNELKGTMSGYQIAKEMSSRLGITVANANYYVTRVFSR